MARQYFQELSRGFLYWLVFPAIITFVGMMFPPGLINQSTMLMLYLINVLLCAMQADHPAVLATSLSSFLLLNYFFITPLHSLRMDSLGESIAALFFIGFCAMAGTIAWRLKRQVRTLRTQSEFLRMQIALGHKLQTIEKETDTAPLLASVAADVFQDKLRFQLLPPNTAENPENIWRVTWAMRDATPLDADRQAMLISIREQVQAVMSRLSVSNALKQAERKGDEDRLRNALLSSVSHDLKTPLLGVIEAATRLRQEEDALTADQRRALLDSILTASRRLEGYIQNLLDMTRLGYGTLSLSREPVALHHIIREVMERMTRHRPRHHVVLDMPESLPTVDVHAALIEQAIFNGLDNAVKAGGESSEVRFSVQKTPGTGLEINICDHGPGLPESEWEQVFDQFYTYKQEHEEFEKGAGLGLSICRSIMRVHGGDARIVPPPKDYKHCLQITLPL